MCNVAIISGLILQQLPGQIDAFGVEALVQRSQQPEGYAALNEQLLSQLTYQLADSDKKVRVHSCVTDYLKKVDAFRCATHSAVDRCCSFFAINALNDIT